VHYDFQVQPYVDDQKTPIEDPSQPWDAPWTSIARLILPKCDLAAEAAQRVMTLAEDLSFDPWHACEELRPLGEMMRARKHAYFKSTQARSASPEPEGNKWPE
jgi:hypothetical protein